MRSSTRILDLGREKHIMARPAQPRSVASQAGGDTICVRHVGAAQPKRIRCAGLSLLVRPLGDCRRFGVEQERKRSDPASDWMLWPHTSALSKNCFHRSSRTFLPAKMPNSRLLSPLVAAAKPRCRPCDMEPATTRRGVHRSAGRKSPSGRRTPNSSNSATCPLSESH